MSSASPLLFGIYPFSSAGMVGGVAQGAVDDLKRLPGIIDELRGSRPLLLRGYLPYSGDASVPTALLFLQMFAASGAPWDVVLQFQFDGDDLGGWIEFIRLIVTRFGKSINSLQITGEPNLRGLPDCGDGSRPQVRRALRDGVLVAKSAAIACGATLSIGMNAVPTRDPADDFWPAVRGFGDDFAASIDYVGLDMYPDVFGPAIPLENLPAAVEAMLRHFRSVDLAAGGIGSSVPIRITENGWPTGPTRSDAQQSAALEAIIRSIHALRSELNITHYELFSLRDADSGNPGLFHQFGIMRDDYTPKPAFEMYKRLIEELGSTEL